MKLTEDPISILLVVASVGLLALYFHEDSRLAELDDAEARAQAIDLGPLQDESCEAHAAGFEGRVLFIRCEHSEGAERIAGLVEGAGVSAGFSSIKVATPQESVRCALVPGDLSCLKAN